MNPCAACDPRALQVGATLPTVWFRSEMSKRDRPAVSIDRLVKESRKSTRDVIGVLIRKSPGRPHNAGIRGRPDLEEWSRECRLLWGGEPPVYDETLIDRMYDVNKDLADYLRDRVTIVVPNKAAQLLVMRGASRKQVEGS